MPAGPSATRSAPRAGPPPAPARGSRPSSARASTRSPPGSTSSAASCTSDGASERADRRPRRGERRRGALVRPPPLAGVRRRLQAHRARDWGLAARRRRGDLGLVPAGPRPRARAGHRVRGARRAVARRRGREDPGHAARLVRAAQPGRDGLARTRLRAEGEAREVRRVRPAVRPPPAARVARADAATLRRGAQVRARPRHIASRAHPPEGAHSETMFVFKAAVVGAGTMGGQIAQTIASAGIPVVLKDVKDDLVEAGLAEARKVTQNQVSKLVERGKLDEEAAGLQVAQVVDRIHGTTEYDGFGDVDFVVEAVPERMEIKRAVFADLDAVTPGHAILASNPSSLSITEIGEATSRPDRVCGFHYFYPASVMRLLEVIEGDDTSSETLSAAVAFAQTIRKMPITCAEVPGFVVNRILNSAMSEVWRVQEEKALSIKKIDEAVTEAKTAPMGPFYLADILGLDTILHVAEYLDAAYPGRMHVHGGLRELVAAGKLGAKSGGSGFYENGTPQIAGDGDPDPEELADRFNLKAPVESCLLVEEGVVSTKDADLGMMAGAGLMPPPFARADATGLDEVVRKLETAAEDWGARYAPPLLLRRLTSQGRTGLKAGQGFFPYKRPDAEGFDQGGTVTLETRRDIAIAWLAHPPMNALSPDVVSDLRRVWEHVRDGGTVRALVLASANPQVFCAGADIKSFTRLDASTGRDFIAGAHALLRDMERSSVATIAAVNAIAFGGGCELAMGCDVRIAAQSALFGQPEINLGIMPGLGGTQRLPRLVRTNKALEMNLTGDPISAEAAYEFGLVNRVVPDHELLDTALAWARKLAGQAPLSVQRIKQVTADPALDAGIEAEIDGFLASLGSEDGREGVAAFLEKRAPQWRGA